MLTYYIFFHLVYLCTVPIHPSLHISVSVSLSISKSIFVYIYLPVYLSNFLSIYLSFWLSIILYPSLSLFLCQAQKHRLCSHVHETLSTTKIPRTQHPKAALFREEVSDDVCYSSLETNCTMRSPGARKASALGDNGVTYQVFRPVYLNFYCFVWLDLFVFCCFFYHLHLLHVVFRCFLCPTVYSLFSILFCCFVLFSLVFS